jgi:hypothetical protein
MKTKLQLRRMVRYGWMVISLSGNAADQNVLPESAHVQPPDRLLTKVVLGEKGRDGSSDVDRLMSAPPPTLDPGRKPITRKFLDPKEDIIFKKTFGAREE